MVEFFREWVLNIVVTAVILVFIELLIPSGKAKKMVNLVSGFILIIAIIQPFIRGIWGEPDLDWFNEALGESPGISGYSGNQYYKPEDSDDSTIISLREKQASQIVEVYRERVTREIEQVITREVKGIKSVEVDLLINEDYNSQKFGEIQRVYATIEIAPAQEEVPGPGEIIIEPIPKIDRVEINLAEGREKQDSPEKTDEKTYSTGESGQANRNIIITRLEDKISELLGIRKEDIVISFR